MLIKIAINGFGRIGRSTFKRILDKHSDLENILYFRRYFLKEKGKMITS